MRPVTEQLLIERLTDIVRVLMDIANSIEDGHVAAQKQTENLLRTNSERNAELVLIGELLSGALLRTGPA